MAHLFRHRLVRFAGLVIGCMVGISAAFAEPTSTEQKAAAPEQSLQGEIVDPASYLKEGRHGAEMTDQTYEAVDGGQTLALLEEGTGTLYLLLSEQAGEDPSELAYDSVNKKVTVKGHVYERGGVHGLVATSLEPIGPTETPSKSSEATPSASTP